MYIKKEVPEFKPVGVILETQKELDMFLDVIEKGYLQFNIFSPERDLAIAISDSISCYATDYFKPETDDDVQY